MKILFIGGTGNISAECATLLHERGHEILVLSRGQTPVPAQYRAIRADRKDPSAMQAALKGVQPDVVLNFLGYDLPEVQTDYELFRGAVQQYVFISSTVVYVKPAPRLPVTEDTPSATLTGTTPRRNWLANSGSSSADRKPASR